MKLTKFTWVHRWLYSPIWEDQILRQTEHVTLVEVGTALASCCLSFLAKRSLSLCSFLSWSLCTTPVWIEPLQLGRSLASCSHFMSLILHCLRLCLRLSLKHFHCPPSGYISHWSVYCTGTSLGARIKAYRQGGQPNKVGSW